MEKQTVCVWTDEDGRIVIHADASKIGDPCLVIEATKEDVWEWIFALMQLVNNGDQFDLPGRFTVICDEDGDL